MLDWMDNHPWIVILTPVLAVVIAMNIWYWCYATEYQRDAPLRLIGICVISVTCPPGTPAN